MNGESQSTTARFSTASRRCGYDPGDPYAHYALALAFGKKGEQDGSIETYAAARKHFRAMLDINSDLEESKIAKRNIAAIDSALNAAK